MWKCLKVFSIMILVDMAIWMCHFIYFSEYSRRNFYVSSIPNIDMPISSLSSGIQATIDISRSSAVSDDLVTPTPVPSSSSSSPSFLEIDNLYPSTSPFTRLPWGEKPPPNGVTLSCDGIYAIHNLTDWGSVEESFDFSLVTQSSVDRLFVLKYIMGRWPGPISIACAIYPSETETFDSLIHSLSFPPRILIHPLYLKSANDSFPINRLRNFAMSKSISSHFWMTDIDMWPSNSLYSKLHSLPHSFKSDDHLAIIVPAFEFANMKCGSYEQCAERVSHIHFTSPADIFKCMKNRHCSPFRPWDRLHDYHFNAWFQKEYERVLTNMTCFPGVTQEPYVVVKHTHHIPLFDERFQNYGFNKVQWIEHLRFRGFVFSVLSGGWGFDLPHEKSIHRDSFDSEGGTESNNLKYITFRHELKMCEQNREVHKLCTRRMLVRPVG